MTQENVKFYFSLRHYKFIYNIQKIENKNICLLYYQNNVICNGTELRSRRNNLCNFVSTK